MSLFAKRKVPQLSPIELVTLRPGTTEDSVTRLDIFHAQVIWGFDRIHNLDPDRRKELCPLLVKFAKKLAPELEKSDAFRLWAKCVQNPNYPDDVMKDVDDSTSNLADQEE